MIAIGCERTPVCGEALRRERLREGALNGIDYVEADGAMLCVHFFGDIPDGLALANVRIRGGRRIRDLRVIAISPDVEPDMHDDAYLRVTLDREGDHSTYCLCIVTTGSPDDPAAWQPYEGFDPRYACADVRFHIDCPEPLDCKNEASCPPTAPGVEEINYLAKDYASFRQLMLDRMSLKMPGWQERHVPDLGIALVEALAYTADYLSYYQDAVATEAYLDTARKRISVRRHARLVDYRLHEGCNARALLTIATDTKRDLALSELRFLVPPPGQEATAEAGVIDAATLDKARDDGALVFEPMPLDGATVLTILPAHNTIRIYTWGDELCCLPRGSTRATLVDRAQVPPTNGDAQPAPTPSTKTPAAAQSSPRDAAAPKAATPPDARVLALAPGDFLIFEEVLGPETGNPADADPAHRHAVRLTSVEQTVDPLYDIELLEVAWDPCDALPFDLCLSVRTAAPACTMLEDISVARGNVVLVDHGDHMPQTCECNEICAPSDGARVPGLATALAVMPDACERCASLAEECWLVPGSASYGCCVCEGAVLDVLRVPECDSHALKSTPLTFAEPVAPNAPVCRLFARDPRAALAQIDVYGGPVEEILIASTPAARWRWTSRYDLLESGPDDRHFAVEIDDEGIAHLRTGDGALGRRVEAGDFFRARTRIGNGPAGNVGRDSIVWMALTGEDLSGATIVPRNPLPASGGTAAEDIAEVKLYAPGTFRAQPQRAITADDYAAFAAKTSGVQGAACTLEWTGSWYEANVVVDPFGSETLAAPLASTIKRSLYRYRRIGHDLAVEPAVYVPMSIALDVCVLPDFIVAHVQAELIDRFGSGLRRNGTPAFFHPDRLRLGEPVYLSCIVAEAQSVVGVAHVEITRAARLDGDAGDALASGVLALGTREIARVDSDSDFPENGSIAFTMRGGR